MANRTMSITFTSKGGHGSEVTRLSRSETSERYRLFDNSLTVLLIVDVRPDKTCRCQSRYFGWFDCSTVLRLSDVLMIVFISFICRLGWRVWVALMMK